MKAIYVLTLIGFLATFPVKSIYSSDQLPVQSRIVGGQEYRIEQVPSTVALIDNTLLTVGADYYQSQYCGGTVINAQWVVTAAHCLFNIDGTPKPATDTSVLMGATNLTEPSSDPINIVSIVIHPDYLSPLQGADIALLELETESTAPSIAIDDVNVTDGELAFVAGWGALNQAEPNQPQSFPNRLQGGFLRLVPAPVCTSRYEEYEGAVSSSMLCADRDINKVDTCQGDSGGPLYRVSLNDGVVDSLTGITSWGIGCGEDDTPGVYTLVGVHIQWMRSVVGQITLSTDERASNNTEPVISGLLPMDDDPGALSSLDELGTGSIHQGMPILVAILWALRRRSIRSTIHALA